MQRKSLWGSYKTLDPRTRIMLGMGGMMFATAGIFLSDYLETKRPATAQEKDEMDRLSPVIVVDRETSSAARR